MYGSSVWPAAVYAIGDVHGRLDLLIEMERVIAADAEAIEGEKWIVLLGDLIDRGSHSASVIDHVLTKPPSGFLRICIAGNHEVMMCRFLRGDYSNGWLDVGGSETLNSYGIDRHLFSQRRSRDRLKELLSSHIPEEHVDFLTSMPKYVCLPGCAFLHALSGQASEENFKTTRGMLLSKLGLDYPSSLDDLLLVHGHDIVKKAGVIRNRLNVDTGAYLTGRLSAVRLLGLTDIHFIEVSVD